MQTVKFERTGYRRELDMSYRYAKGAKNVGDDFDYGSLVDKEAMDMWLTEQNERLTNELRNQFGDTILSAGYYFDMQDRQNPGYLDVVVSEPFLTITTTRMIDSYLDSYQKSFAKQFNKQPFAQTDAGFAKLSSTDAYILYEDVRAITHTRQVDDVPVDHYEKELDLGEDCYVTITRGSSSFYHYLFEITAAPSILPRKSLDSDAVTSQLNANVNQFILGADIKYDTSENKVVLSMQADPSLDVSKIVDILHEMDLHETVNHLYSMPFTLEEPFEEPLFEWDKGDATANYLLKHLVSCAETDSNPMIADIAKGNNAFLIHGEDFYKHLTFGKCTLLNEDSGCFWLGTSRELNYIELAYLSRTLVEDFSAELPGMHLYKSFEPVSKISNQLVDLLSYTQDNTFEDDSTISLSDALTILEEEVTVLEQ